MPRNTLVPTLGLFCFTLVAPLFAKESTTPASSTITSGICGHGAIHNMGDSFEAIVTVSTELIPNIRPGQQVFMDVRQGQLRGTVKGVKANSEITIALDAGRSRIKLSRLQHGQAVIATIQLEPDCDCSSASGKSSL